MIPELSKAELEELSCYFILGKAAFSVIFSNLSAKVLDIVSSPDMVRRIFSEPEAAGYALSVKNKLIQTAVRKITKNAEKKAGLTSQDWNFIQQYPENFSGYGPQALLAGLYSLAIDLGLECPFKLGLAAAACGKKEVFTKALLLLDPETEMGRLQKAGLEAMKARIEGHLSKAVEMYEYQIEHVLRSVEAGDEADEHLLGEIYLIGGGIYFFSANYYKARALYSRAHEIFGFLESSGRAAVAAFNTAVALNHLGSSSLVSEYLISARLHLEKYNVPGLELSIDLFEIECHAGATEYAEGLEKVLRLLENRDLSPTQQIVGLQTKARMLVEQGRLIEAEISLGQSRQIIAQNGFLQFEAGQMALEKEIEALTYRKLSVSHCKTEQEMGANKRGFALIKLAVIRQVIAEGAVKQAAKLFGDFCTETPSTVQNNLYFKDVEVALLNSMMTVDFRPRGFQAQIFKALSNRNFSHMQYLTDSFETESMHVDSPWGRAAIHLGKSLVSLSNVDFRKAHESAELAIGICEKNGLEKLLSLALAVSSACDQHRQLQWQNHLRQVPKTVRCYLQELLSDVLPKDIFVNSWMITSDNGHFTPYQNQGEEALSSFDLIIDQDKGSVIYRGEVLPLTGQSVLFRLLIQIGLSQSKGIDKSEIVELTWGYKYDPIVHDPLVYMNVRRLRKLVPIELYQGRYRLSKAIKWQCVTSSSVDIQMKRHNLTSRQLAIVNLVRATQHKIISRKEVVNILQMSPRTALRELTYLVEIDIMNRDGLGRGAHYALKGKGA